MYQNRISLENFATEVIKEGDKYFVTYSDGGFTGVCEYNYVNLPGQIKPIRQKVLLLTSCKMGDIIEKINMDSPLKSEDLTGITMKIREHSLHCVEDYIIMGD